MVLILLNALLPIFIGLLLGYIAGRRGVMDNVNVRNLIVLVMDFAIPCALFSTISSTSWSVLREQSESAVVIAVVFVTLYVATYVWARSLRMSISNAAVLALTVGFPNSAAVALPLLTTAYGPSSRVTAALSIAVGAITISPMTVALLDFDRLSDGKGISMKVIALKFLRSFTRPVVWAPTLALVSVYFGLHLPSYLDRPLTILGSAASGSALILTGLVVSSQTFRFDGKVAVAVAAINLIQPLFALGITELLHMSHAAVRDITLISAIPAGFFGIVFGRSFNATPETASSALIASYIVGAFSLAVWMLVITRYL
jgi:malonate transporter and related proteins